MQTVNFLLKSLQAVEISLCSFFFSKEPLLMNLLAIFLGIQREFKIFEKQIPRNDERQISIKN